MDLCYCIAQYDNQYCNRPLYLTMLKFKLTINSCDVNVVTTTPRGQKKLEHIQLFYIGPLYMA